MLHFRDKIEITILYGGRLLQHYVVDQHIKIETIRLDYFYNNQDKVRAELCQAIMDSVNDGEIRGDTVGKRVILPTSFIEICGNVI